MKAKGVSIILTVLFVVLVWGHASADEVWLKNGDRLTGKVMSLDAAPWFSKRPMPGTCPSSGEKWST